jgi:AcrR family transcriptional regulator
MTTRTRGRPRSFDRDAALDAAIRVFWARGYEAASVRDLTGALSIGAPSLYHAFGGKHQLFEEALEVYDGRYGGFIETALTEGASATQAIERILDEAPGRYTRRGLPAGCLVVSGAEGTTDPAARAAVRRLRQRKVRLLARAIEKDVSDGVLPEDTDADALARFVLAILTGLAHDAREGVPRARLARTAAVAKAAWARASGASKRE